MSTSTTIVVSVSQTDRGNAFFIALYIQTFNRQMRDQVKSSRPAKNSSKATSVPYPYSHLTKSEIVRLFHLEDIQEPLTPREFTRCAIAVVSRWCDNVLTGRYSSVESVGSKLDCLERIYKNR